MDEVCVYFKGNGMLFVLGYWEGGDEIGDIITDKDGYALVALLLGVILAIEVVLCPVW